MAETIKGMNKLMGFFKPAKQRQIIKNTVNKLATDAKRSTVKNITDNYNLSSRTVSPRLTIRRASVYELIARIFDNNHRRLSIMDFKRTTQTRDGISKEIRKGDREVLPRTFIRQPKGNSYMRQGQKRPVTATKRLPLQRQTRAAYPLRALKAQTVAQMAGGEWNLKLLNRMIIKNGQGYVDIEMVKALRKAI